MDVHARISLGGEIMRTMTGSDWQCGDMQAIWKVRSQYEWYANIHKLPDVSGFLINLNFTYMRAAAQKYWHEWSAGWRLFWMKEVEPVVCSSDERVWAPRMRALLQGKPNIVVQIVIRSARGVDMESQAWWVDRNGFEKAVLDRIVPIDDAVAVVTMRKEKWVLGY